MGTAASAFRSLADSRLEALKSKSAADLLLLQPESEEVVQVLDRSGSISVMVEAIDSRTVQVIVQGSLRFRWWPFGSDWFADGFRKTEDGALLPVPTEVIRIYD